MVEELRDQLEGTLATPADADYDALRASWNLTFEQRPALVVEAADEDDVVAALGFAHEQRMTVTVQSTGHGAGVTCADGLLLRTGRLSAVAVDPVLRVARIGAGARWSDVLPATAAHGLAPLLGFNPHVGVVGYTLGGGLGWLSRRHGLAVDSVRALDVVLPDATHVRVTPAAEPDLFWALRGGASAFGVVVALELELVEAKELFGGQVLYPGERAADVIAAYADWVEQAPEEVTSSIAVIRFPPLPEVPEPLRGVTAVAVGACVQAAAEQAEALLAPLRALAQPLADTFRPLDVGDLGTLAFDPVDPMPAAGHADVVGALTPELQALLAETAEGARPLVVVELRHLGGALARPAAADGPIPRPAGDFLFHAETVVPPGPAGANARGELLRLATAVAPHVAGPPLPSFLGELEPLPGRLEQAFPADARARLGRLKRRYDPDERFRHGRPIPLAWGG